MVRYEARQWLAAVGVAAGDAAGEGEADLAEPAGQGLVASFLFSAPVLCQAWLFLLVAGGCPGSVESTHARGERVHRQDGGA